MMQTTELLNNVHYLIVTSGLYTNRWFSNKGGDPSFIGIGHCLLIPSGKRLHNYGKIHHAMKMGSHQLFLWPLSTFSIAMFVYQRVNLRLFINRFDLKTNRPSMGL